MLDRKIFREIIQGISSSLFERSQEVELALICLLAEGHLLIEDLPGTGKTSLSKKLAEYLNLSFSRIQMTNDLLPADITGQFIFNRQRSDFEFKQGPLFAQVILVDELNRASPRTQSSLLQALEEKQISLDRQTFDLPECFFVIATQNPSEQVGTAFLPESQLDRFMMGIQMTPLSKKSEELIFKNPYQDIFNNIKLPSNIRSHLDTNELLLHKKALREVTISDSVAKYISDLIQMSKLKAPQGTLSIRAGISLAKASQAKAYILGQSYVTHEHVKSLVKPVFSHRLSNNEGLSYGQHICQKILDEVSIEF